jgi:hypothetical protein
MNKNLHPDNHIEDILRNKVLESSLKLPSNAWEAMNELIDVNSTAFESLSQEEAIIQKNTVNASVELPTNAWHAMSVLLNSNMPSLTALNWYVQAKRRYFCFLFLISLLPLKQPQTDAPKLNPVAESTTEVQAIVATKAPAFIHPVVAAATPLVPYALNSNKTAPSITKAIETFPTEVNRAMSSAMAQPTNLSYPTLPDYQQPETRMSNPFDHTNLSQKTVQLADNQQNISAEAFALIKTPEANFYKTKSRKVQFYATAGANFSYYDKTFFEGNRWSSTTLTTPEQEEIEVLTNFAKNQEASTPVQFYPGMVLGVGVELPLSKHLSLNPELSYKQKTNINLASTTVLKKGTDIEALNGQDIQVIKSLVNMQITRQLHFISLPILFNYQLNRHKIMGGVRADFLIREVKQSIRGETASTINNSQVQILSYNSRQVVMPDKTVFEEFDFGLVLGYAFQLSNRFSANARLNYGLKDMTRMQYGEMQGFHRNIDVQLMLRYNLF